ncbi:MAG: glycosyltransferase family 4 protein [Nanoarchaeota archaeon]|nr:glycosyltransferase family 4 protein [Nanoarchaeota archaeon]
MKICIVTFEYPPQIGGISHAVNRIAKGLLKKGVEMHIVAVTPNNRTSFSENSVSESGNAIVHRFGPSSGDLKHISGKEAEDLSNYLIELDKEHDFDLFHAFTIFPCGYITVKIAKKLGKPVIVSGRGEDGAIDLNSHNLEEKRWAVKNANYLTFVSTEMMNHVDCFERCKYKSKVILNSLDPSEFYFLPHFKKPELKGFVIGIATTIREIKGFEYLLEAFARFSKKYESTLILAGDFRTIDLKKKYLLLIHKLGIRNKVVITGLIKHKFILNYIDLMDVYVLPSVFSEGCPNSLLEAMYLGKPVIGSDIGAIPEIIEHKKNGLLFALKNVAGIYENLILLKEDKELCKEIKSEVKRTIIQKFKYDKEPKRWFKIYNEIIKLP